MKTVLNFLKTLLNGILPTVAGGLVAINLLYIINNIKEITIGSGWIVVHHFAMALIETILLVCLWYELGIINNNSKNWIKYKRSLTADTMNGNSCDCETSDEVTNTYCDCDK